MTLFNNFCAAILAVASSCGTAINDAARIIFGFFAAGTNAAVGFLPTIRRMKLATAFLAVAVAIPLMSACGGGGGSGFTRPTPEIDPALIPRAAETGGDAANSIPRFGSVVQSSNRDGAGVTTDTVNVVVNSGADTFSIAKGASGLTFEVSDTDPDIEPAQCTSDCPFDNWFADIRHDDDGDGTADGDLLVDFFVADLAMTPTTPRLPAEWLAGGIWWYLPDDVSDIGDIEFGAFVDGQDPFETSSLTELTGSATYSTVGGAAGVRIEQFSTADADGELGDTEYFTADVEITANFGTDMISGTIGNFDFDDSDARRTLTLRQTSIPGTGDFNGMVSDTAAPTATGGRWGGQFFVDGNTATDLPGTVGGTFGFSEDTPRPGTATEAIIGFFGARRP